MGRMKDLSIMHGEIENAFDHLIMPILLQTKDTTALSYLTKQHSFAITAQDLNSFVSITLQDKWLQGFKAMLLSPTAQFQFSTRPFED